MVLAINKMDLVDYSHEVFDQIDADYREFAAQIGLDDVTCDPAVGAARATTSSQPQRRTCPGTTGPTLMGYLETSRSTTRAGDGAVPPAGAVGQPARTSTSAASAGIDRRAAPCGRATASRVAAVGAREHASRASSRMDGDLDEAVAGQSVTLTLADEIDVSRGDVLAAADAPPGVADQFEAHDRLDGRGAAAARAARTC